MDSATEEPTKYFSIICVICRNKFEDTQRRQCVATRCGHLYHRVCLINWLAASTNSTCPTCRDTIAIPKDVITMYLPYMENDDLKMKIAKLQKKLLEAGSPKNDDGAQTSTGPERRVTRSMRAKKTTLDAASVNGQWITRKLRNRSYRYRL